MAKKRLSVELLPLTQAEHGHEPISNRFFGYFALDEGDPMVALAHSALPPSEQVLAAIAREAGPAIGVAAVTLALPRSGVQKWTLLEMT